MKMNDCARFRQGQALTIDLKCQDTKAMKKPAAWKNPGSGLMVRVSGAGLAAQFPDHVAQQQIMLHLIRGGVRSDMDELNVQDGAQVAQVFGIKLIAQS